MTAGAGAAVALTLFITPAPTAVSDPGPRGSHSGQSHSRDDARARGGETPRSRGSRNESRADGGRRSGRVEARDGALLTGTATQPTQGALRSTGSGETGRTGESATAQTTSEQAGRPSVTTPDGARTVRTARSARGADATAGGSGRRPIVAPTPVPAGPERAQYVRADGATAAPVSLPPRPQPAADAPGGAAAFVPVPPSAPAAVLPSPRRISVPRAVEVALPAPPLAPDRRPGQPMTSLFGVLGLLLIPMAGAALGYRQARAARSVGVLPHV